MIGSARVTFGDSLGLLQPDDGSPCVLFHAASLVDVSYRDLRDGDCLSWDSVPTIGELKSGMLTEIRRAFAATCSDGIYAKEHSTTDTAFQRQVTGDLIRRLNRDPSGLFVLTPRQFEELVADLFVLDGYTVELLGTCNQADGGVDIIAISQGSGWQQLKTAIQCKRYAAGRKVSAAPIRALAGVLDRFQAHTGVLVTTSDFTKPASIELLDYWRITGVNYDRLRERLVKAELLLPPVVSSFREGRTPRSLDKFLTNVFALNIRRM